MAVNFFSHVLCSLLAVGLLQSSLCEAAQILSTDAQNAEVLEHEATELRCVVTLSNPDNESATVTIEKIDTGELLTSTENVSQHLSAVYEINAASKSDEGQYRCNVSVGESNMSVTFSLSVIDHTPLYVIGNPDHYNSIDSSETLVVTCDIMGVPQPIYKWEKEDGQKIGSTPLNNKTGPYVASNGSLLLDKALPADSGVYVCYGIDSLTGENATSYYIITIEEGSSIWVSWYFFLIYAVVFLAAVIIVGLVCFLIFGTRDICIDLSKRGWRKDAKEAAARRNLLENVSANPAYQINFSDEEEQTSLMEEEYASSDEELVEDEEHGKETATKREGKETRMKQSSLTPDSLKIQGLLRHQEMSSMEEKYASSDEELVEDEEHGKEMATEREGNKTRMEQSSVTPDSLKIQGLLQHQEMSFIEEEHASRDEELVEDEEHGEETTTEREGKETRREHSSVTPDSLKIQGSLQHQETSSLEETYASSNKELTEDEEYGKEMATERDEKETRMEQSSLTPDSLKIQGSLQHQETSSMEEKYASSDEELVEDEEHGKEIATEREGKETRMEQSSLTPDSLESQGLLQHQSSTEEDSTTHEDSDDVSLIEDSQPSLPESPSQPIKNRQASSKPPGSLAKEPTHQKRSWKQKALPKKRKAGGRHVQDQKPMTFEMLY